MKKHFNSTGRRRIGAGQVGLLALEGSKPPAFLATLRLDALELPGDAEVVLEAYRQSATERFPLGPLSKLKADRRIELKEIAAEEAVFRVKVVEPATGRILAMRRRHRPGDVEESGRIPLLSVREDDLGPEPWRTMVEQDEAVLVVNAAIPDAMARLKRGGPFQALVLPAAFRQMLMRLWACRAQAEDDEGDADGWQGRWMRFALALAGSEEEPDWMNEHDAAGWIDKVCRSFAERHDMMQSLAVEEA